MRDFASLFTFVILGWVSSMPVLGQDSTSQVKVGSLAAQANGQDVMPPLPASRETKLKLKGVLDRMKASGRVEKWDDIDVRRRPETKSTPDQDLQRKRKMVVLMDFCRTERLQNAQIVDELDFLSDSDKAFCKEQIPSSSSTSP